MSTFLRLMCIALLAIPAMLSRPVAADGGKAVKLKVTEPSRTPEVREALVIANQDYTVMRDGKRRPSGVLALPMADAKRIRSALEGAGFHVTLVTNVTDYAAMERVIETFVDRVREREAVAFVYYTGHAAGLQMSEGPETYLTPVRLEEIKSDRNLASQSYPLSAIIRKLRSAGTRLELVVVDACRNNPFLDGLPVGYKSYLTNGLPRTRVTRKEFSRRAGSPGQMPARGTVLFYAALEGDTTGDNGLYAQAWEAVLRTPGLSLDEVPNRLNALVIESGGEMADARPVFTGQFRFVEVPLPPRPTLLPAAAPAPLPGDPAGIRFKRPDLTWLSVPGGSFTMGGNDGDGDEKPSRTVLVSSFQMTKTEITNAQYSACVYAGECRAPRWDQCASWTGTEWKYGSVPEAFKDDNKPVVCINWLQAKAFAAWVDARLPSEAEWEYAARGRVGLKFPWGNTPEPTCDRAVYGSFSKGCDAMSTAHVCSQIAGNTPEGLCDMAGNVWEWVEDCYNKDYRKAPTDGAARTLGCSSPTSRVVRGGGWIDGATGLRSANRYWGGVDDRANNVGFRVVRSAPDIAVDRRSTVLGAPGIEIDDYPPKLLISEEPR